MNLNSSVPDRSYLFFSKHDTYKYRCFHSLSPNSSSDHPFVNIFILMGNVCLASIHEGLCVKRSLWDVWWLSNKHPIWNKEWFGATITGESPSTILTCQPACCVFSPSWVCVHHKISTVQRRGNPETEKRSTLLMGFTLFFDLNDPSFLLVFIDSVDVWCCCGWVFLLDDDRVREEMAGPTLSQAGAAVHLIAALCVLAQVRDLHRTTSPYLSLCDMKPTIHSVT